MSTHDTTASPTTLEAILMNLATKMTADATMLQKLSDQLTDGGAPEPTRAAEVHGELRPLTDEELALFAPVAASDALAAPFIDIDDCLDDLEETLTDLGVIPAGDTEAGMRTAEQFSEAFADIEKALQHLFRLIQQTGLMDFAEFA